VKLSLKEDVTEKLVTKAWQSLLTAGCKLKTESGHSLQVVYPGKTSDAPGSDFQDAVIKINRHILKGNIEVHVNSSDWRKHGHHLNPVYNSVILHVAMWHDCPGDIAIQNGDVIQAVTIDKYLKSDKNLPVSGMVICAGIGKYPADKLLEIIDRAGAVRFYEKAAQFQNHLKYQNEGQCLYCGIMTALGYARNQGPFRELAERVPLAVLESEVYYKSEVEDNQIRRETLLLGTAGLLPSQRPECEYSPFEDYAYVNTLERVFETLKRIDVMDYYSWQSFRVRPSNSPLRRIVGMSHLLQRYGGKGLLAGLITLVREVPPENGRHFLEAGLMVEDDGYWGNRFDFGKGYPGLSKWLIGQSRAADIVINVLLPFVYAWGRKNGQTELADKAFTIFCSYPPVETNTVERHMRVQFGLQSTQVNSARRQQGLLHIYKKWCTQGRCRECAVMKHKNFNSQDSSIEQ